MCTVVIDSREQTPFVFPDAVQTCRGTLQSGDYSIRGLEHLFSVERKSIADLVASVTWERDRFERELHRLRGFRFKRLVIVGSRAEVESGAYRSKANPKAVIASLETFEVRYDIPIAWAIDSAAGGLLVAKWAHRFAREIIRAADQLK